MSDINDPSNTFGSPEHWWGRGGEADHSRVASRTVALSPYGRGMPDDSDASARVPGSTIAMAIVADALLVLGFAAVGRASHERGVLGDGGIGLLTTAWPFLLALGVGWLVSRAWRAPLAPLRTGVPVWLVTVAGGMLLRALSGQGTAVPFVVVATLTLLALLVGWRLVAALVRRGRARRSPTVET